MSVSKAWKYRHRLAFDFSGVETVEARKVLQYALNYCDFPFLRMRKATRSLTAPLGLRMPVSTADCSRWARGQVEGDPNHFHPLSPTGEKAHGLAGTIKGRRTALGLYWLPTSRIPTGRIELERSLFPHQADVFREVLLAESAHGMDYTTMSETDRAAIFAIIHHDNPAPHGTHAWFEERGGEAYFADWVGEVWMGLFMETFAPTLPRPLGLQQPWTHTITPEMVPQVRQLLLG